MTQTHRFGRRLLLPSTRQIRHELRVLLDHEDAKKRAAEEGMSNASLKSEPALAEDPLGGHIGPARPLSPQ